jgi:thioredoxin 1
MRRSRLAVTHSRLIATAYVAGSFDTIRRLKRMATQNVLELDDNAFDTEVLQSDVPVLVDFWASWCQPCLMLAPTIDALADEYQGKVKVAKVDIEKNQNIAANYEINSIPTVLIFKGGELQKKFVGLTSKENFKSAIDQLL